MSFQLAVLVERVVARFARDDDHRNRGGRWVPLQLIADRKPIGPRKLDREDDEIGVVGRDGLLSPPILGSGA